MARSKASSKRSASPFRFESFGARIEIAGNDQAVVDRAVEVSRVSLIDQVNELHQGPVDTVLEVNRNDNVFQLLQNGVELATGEDEPIFYKFFDTIVRVSVAEASHDRVFIHAGVVGWKGKAIILPADSFKGKSTLVAELVRAGAEYYSDDFAVFDENGLLHPFHRPVGMRSSSGEFKTYQVTVEDLKGMYGHQPIPAGVVLFTEYKKNARWRPRQMTPGEGVLELVQYALPMRQRPEFAFRVLNIIASRAIIISSLRGTAENFVKTLLNFVDKHVN